MQQQECLVTSMSVQDQCAMAALFIDVYLNVQSEGYILLLSNVTWR